MAWASPRESAGSFERRVGLRSLIPLWPPLPARVFFYTLEPSVSSVDLLVSLELSLELSHLGLKRTGVLNVSLVGCLVGKLCKGCPVGTSFGLAFELSWILQSLEVGMLRGGRRE